MKIGVQYINSNIIREHEARSEIDDNSSVIDGSMKHTGDISLRLMTNANLWY